MTLDGESPRRVRASGGGFRRADPHSSNNAAAANVTDVHLDLDPTTTVTDAAADAVVTKLDELKGIAIYYDSMIVLMKSVHNLGIFTAIYRNR